MELEKSRFYDWKKRFGQKNQHNYMVPKETWILPQERQAIIDYFIANPRNGCKRLAWMMVDEGIACVSHNTVYRVLKSEGLLDRVKASTSLKGKGFDQPNKPHEQWHIDVSYINAGGTFYYLCSILDGFSRFIVHHEISESMTQDKIQLIVQKAREKVGSPKSRLISDNGPQFKAKQFKRFIKLAGMDHTFTSPYYPESNGKIERWHKELKSNCIRPRGPRDLKEARAYVEDFVEEYNYARLHSAIGYATPFDKLLGIDDKLFEERKVKLKMAKVRRKLGWVALRKNNANNSLAYTAQIMSNM